MIGVYRRCHTTPALGLLVFVAGCTRSTPDPSPSHPALASAPAFAFASASASASARASSWPAALPKPTLPSPGPIQATGFPSDIRTCLPDPAAHAGFTRDGAELGYCMQGMAMRCELLDRDGNTRTMSSQRRGDSPGSDPAKEKPINDFIKDEGLPALTRGDCTLRPPPLTGTWSYPDIVVNVATIAASFKKGPGSSDEKLVSQPMVRIGGAIGGEPPVHPLSYSAPHHVMKPASLGEIPFNTASLNALALSPDGSELGIVIHANCMEWCDEFQVVRMPTSRFASLVYNDVGYRAYKKGALDRAAELFARAAFIDDTRELPAYNLACVYARQGDAVRAEAALNLAITRGDAAAVRARAAKDNDFDAVRTAPWFVRAVSPSP